MRHGSIAIGALPGDYGKPRPLLIIQSDKFDGMAAVTVVPLTSNETMDAYWRIAIAPSQANGLTLRSDIMVDKIMSISREKLTQVIGEVDSSTLARVKAAVVDFLDLA
jgi:mRNA interferase MazF